MFLIFCSRADHAAHAFAKRFAAQDVRTLTCEEVSQPGWRLSIRGVARAGVDIELCAALGGELIPGERLRGVISRLGGVTEHELGHIEAPDRAYVAAEMHAFLFAFLSALPCRKVNHPSPACLYGPNLRGGQWRQLARELGIPVLREADDPVDGSHFGALESEIVVVGDRLIGVASDEVERWSRELALAAGVSCLYVRYRSCRGEVKLMGADPYPRLEMAEVGPALISWLSAESLPC
jgi:hypothetical protein